MLLINSKAAAGLWYGVILPMYDGAQARLGARTEPMLLNDMIGRPELIKYAIKHGKGKTALI